MTETTPPPATAVTRDQPTPVVPAPSPTGQSEVELKLRIPRSALPRLRKLAVLRPPADGRDRVRVLTSRYFDTDSHDLKSHDAALRVRRQNGRFVQTLKTGAAFGAGALRRIEWDAAVPAGLPDWSLVPQEARANGLGDVSTGDLRPVFTTRFRRTIRRLVEPPVAASAPTPTSPGTPARGGTDIEVAIDVGEIIGPDGRTLALAEVELELKHGDPAALFDLARRISAEVPARLETRSKSDRGYALAAGREAGPVVAAPLRLPPEITVDEAISAILRNCLDHVVGNEALVAERADAGALHQMRVGLRRLRSAFGLFRQFIPAADYARLTGEMRWLAGTLGPVRDLDVFMTDLLKPLHAGFGADAGLAALAHTARERRTAMAQRAAADVQSRRYADFVLDLAAWIETRGWRQQRICEDALVLFAPARQFADDVLARRVKRARRRGESFASLSTAAKHDLRIDLKKIRYASEFFQSLYDAKPVRRFQRLAAKLQAGLGHLNDVATAQALIGELCTSAADRGEIDVAAGKVIGWHAHGEQAQMPKLTQSWKRFVEAKPFWSRRKSAN